jgi:hypothetical protein
MTAARKQRVYICNPSTSNHSDPEDDSFLSAFFFSACPGGLGGPDGFGLFCMLSGLSPDDDDSDADDSSFFFVGFFFCTFFFLVPPGDDANLFTAPTGGLGGPDGREADLISSVDLVLLEFKRRRLARISTLTAHLVYHHLNCQTFVSRQLFRAHSARAHA